MLPQPVGVETETDTTTEVDTETEAELLLPLPPGPPGLLCVCEAVPEPPGTDADPLDSEPEEVETVTSVVRERVSVGGGKVTKLDSLPEMIETEPEAELIGTSVEAVDATSVVSVMDDTDGVPWDIDNGGHPEGTLAWPPGPRPGRGMQSVTVLTTSVAVETEAVSVKVDMVMLPETESLDGGEVSEPVGGISTELESKMVEAVVVDGRPCPPGGGGGAPGPVWVYEAVPVKTDDCGGIPVAG